MTQPPFGKPAGYPPPQPSWSGVLDYQTGLVRPAQVVSFSL